MSNNSIDEGFMGVLKKRAVEADLALGQLMESGDPKKWYDHLDEFEPDRLKAQFKYLRNISFELEQCHFHFMVASIIDLISSFLTVDHVDVLNNVDATMGRVLRTFKGSIIIFDAYWALLALYFERPSDFLRDIPMEVQRTGNYNVSIAKNPGFSLNEKLGFQHLDVQENRIRYVIDGHILTPSQDEPFPGTLNQAQLLMSKLQNAAFFSEFLMNAVTIPYDPPSSLSSTPLMFATAIGVGNQPCSLRERVLDTTFNIYERFSIAVRVVRAVIALHACDVQHGNITPEAFSVFDEKTETELVVHPLLHGFHCVPNDLLPAKKAFEHEVFRDWYRMGGGEKNRENDLLDLGVLLLELVGESVEYMPPRKAPGPETEYRRNVVPDLLFDAANRLKLEIGEEYMSAVKNCFQLGNRSLTNESRIEKVHLGVQVIERVLKQLLRADPDQPWHQTEPALAL